MVAYYCCPTWRCKEGGPRALRPEMDAGQRNYNFWLQLMLFPVSLQSFFLIKFFRFVARKILTLQTMNCSYICITIKFADTTLLSTTGQREPSARAPLSWTMPTTLRPQPPSDRPPLLCAHPQRLPMASGQEFRPQTTATVGPLTPPWSTQMAATGWRRRRSPWPLQGWRRRCPLWQEPQLRSETVSPCWRRTWHNWRLPLPEVWKAVWSSDVLFFWPDKETSAFKSPPVSCIKQEHWGKSQSKCLFLFLDIHLSVLQPLPRSSNPNPKVLQENSSRS